MLLFLPGIVIIVAVTFCCVYMLPLMTDKNGSTYDTNFTVSIEAAEGITTGISAADPCHSVSN